MEIKNRRIKFSPGQIICTRRIVEEITPEMITGLIRKHLSGKWGNLSMSDKELNDKALKTRERILSSYPLDESLKQKCNEDKIWIITEWDRSITTVLFPSEY